MRFPPLIVTIIALPIAPTAQTPDSFSLRGRHMLMASIGLTGTQEAVASPGETAARGTGTLGSLTYAHFFTHRTGLEVSASVLDADASTTYANNRATAVTALLVGITVSPTLLEQSRTVRPYVSAAVGSYSHHIASSSAGATSEARTQSKAGARLGLGINFFLARHFGLQLAGNYHVVEPFDAVNGVEKDPSGLSLSLGLALMWGGR